MRAMILVGILFAANLAMADEKSLPPNAGDVAATKKFAKDLLKQVRESD